MIRKIFKDKALCQGKPQLIFASAINEEYSKDFLPREATGTPRHPEAVQNAKMWP